MEEYINGCYTKYGTRPMESNEIKAKARLSNGLWAAVGFIDLPDDRWSIDVYRDEAMTDLVFMDHGCTVFGDELSMLFGLAESRCKEMKL